MAGTAPGSSTFDGNAALGTTTPYRPGINDANGAALANNPVNPPNPTTQPTAQLINWLSLQTISYGKAVAFAGIGVNASATPTTAFFWTAANNIAANPFTITRNAAGNYTISWASGVFPNASGWPKAYLNTILGANNYAIAAVNSTPTSVQVTTTVNGALADVNFSVDIF